MSTPRIRRQTNYSENIPNQPFSLNEENEIALDTILGPIVIKGAVLENNSLRVDPQAFVAGGFDFGTF
jgi:hypothetical protein